MELYLFTWFLQVMMVEQGLQQGVDIETAISSGDGHGRTKNGLITVRAIPGVLVGAVPPISGQGWTVEIA